jgi:hypothetical protein
MAVMPPGRYPMALVAERLDPYRSSPDLPRVMRGTTHMTLAVGGM